jgi:hypothetical protein
VADLSIGPAINMAGSCVGETTNLAGKPWLVSSSV